MYKTTYSPSQQQEDQFSILRRFCTEAQQLNVQYSIFGGYGLDGLVGVLTRDHHDIDLLVKKGDHSKLVEILRKLGFSLSRENDSKEVFKKAELGDFQIELSKNNRLEEFMSIGEDNIFTTDPNGKLGDVVFHTPTVIGHEYIHGIQTKRAIEREWTSSYRYEDSRRELVNYLKMKPIHQ